MNQVMDTSVRILAIALLSLLAGCATERVGQRGAMPPQSPLGRSEVPAATTQEAAQPPSAVAEQAPESTRVDDTQMTAPAVTKQTVDETRKKPQPTPPVVAVPDIKNPQLETSSPPPVARWSRQLSVTQERFIERNENSLLRVYIDMSKAEIKSIMSESRAGDWVNPCKQERLMDNNGKIYDVVFYLSRKPVQSRPFNERLMTPVILRDDRVYAIGRYSLKKLRATSRLVNSASMGCQHV